MSTSCYEYGESITMEKTANALSIGVKGLSALKGATSAAKKGASLLARGVEASGVPAAYKAVTGKLKAFKAQHPHATTALGQAAGLGAGAYLGNRMYRSLQSLSRQIPHEYSDEYVRQGR